MTCSAAHTTGRSRGITFSERVSGIRELPALIFLLLMVGILWKCAPTFVSANNLYTVARETAVFGIMGIGMTMVIITGGIDLSVASVLALSMTVMAMLIVDGTSMLVSIPVGLAIGAGSGVLNAVLINQLRIPPIITTLGTMGVLRAAVTLISGGNWIGPLPQSFEVLASGLTPVAMLLLVAVPATAFLARCRWGRYVHAVGSSEEAVRLSGIAPERVKCLVYTLNGLLASAAGLILVASLSSAQSNTAIGYELNVIAAVVIGGTSISGGQGSIPGTLIGAATMRVLYNSLVLLGASRYWHELIVGAVILAAVLADRLRYSRVR